VRVGVLVWFVGAVLFIIFESQGLLGMLYRQMSVTCVDNLTACMLVCEPWFESSCVARSKIL